MIIKVMENNDYQVSLRCDMIINIMKNNDSNESET